ncbi:MAG: Gmad2 immunoglobulin-like domain-containing protein [Actinomycetota bacterium]
MKRLTLMIVGAGLLASACAGRGASSLGPAPAGDGSSPTPTPTSSPTRPTTSPPSPVPPSPSPRNPYTFQAWFATDYGQGHLFVTKRTDEFSAGVARLAMNALLDGPSEVEEGAGMFTAIPFGVDLLGLDLSSDGVITVDLSSEFELGGSSSVETMRLAQVVYTLTQFRTVKSVRFAIEGRPVDVFGSQGIDVDPPRTRADYEGLLPAIVVESPSIGERVSSPVTVSGTANVFEATVSLKILDASGREIARTFTTATCGTGCRGAYSVSVSYNVDREQQGTIVVFESSAEDGSEINAVGIPVTLTP